MGGGAVLVEAVALAEAGGGSGLQMTVVIVGGMSMDRLFDFSCGGCALGHIWLEAADAIDGFRPEGTVRISVFEAG